MCELSREVEKHSGQAFCRKEMSMDFPYEFISSKLQSWSKVLSLCLRGKGEPKARHEISWDLQVQANWNGFVLQQVPHLNAEPFAALCCFLFSHADADDPPDAADSATGAAGRAQAASAVAYVACAASAAVAWAAAAAAAASSGEAGCGAGASRDANAHGAHGEAGQAIALGVCCPYASYATHPRTQQSGGASIPTGCFDQGGSRAEGASQRGRVWRGCPIDFKVFLGI